MTEEKIIESFNDIKDGVYPLNMNELCDIAIKAIEQNCEIRKIVNHRWASGTNNNALCTVKHIREVIEK